MPTLRRAVAADARLLAELGERTFRDTFAADNTPEDLEMYLASKYGEAKQAAELADPASTFLLAEEAGVVAGYARLVTGRTPECVTGPKPIEIERIYADKPWLGQGIGKFLMLGCLADARGRGFETIWLAVWERNERAYEFYRRWGFERVGEQLFRLGIDVQTDWVLARPV